MTEPKHVPGRRRRPARGATLLVAVLAFVVTAGGPLGAPAPTRAVHPAHEGVTASAVVSVLGAGQARAVHGARSLRTALVHRHGPVPVPGVVPGSLAAGGLLVVALLLLVAASPAARRTAGSSRVRAPPVVRA